MATAVAEEAPTIAGDDQARTPGDHRQRCARRLQLPVQIAGQQQVGQLAVFVGLLGMEGRGAIDHGGSGADLQALKVTQARRRSHPAPGGRGVMDLGGGDHHPRLAAPQEQGQQPLQQALVGQLVDRQGELEPLHRPARFAGAGVLEAGVEHQAVDGFLACQQFVDQALHRHQIGQVGHRCLAGVKAQGVGQGQGRCCGATGQQQPMARRLQAHRRRPADPRAGTGQQDPPSGRRTHAATASWNASRSAGLPPNTWQNALITRSPESTASRGSLRRRCRRQQAATRATSSSLTSGRPS